MQWLACLDDPIVNEVLSSARLQWPHGGGGCGHVEVVQVGRGSSWRATGGYERLHGDHARGPEGETAEEQSDVKPRGDRETGGKKLPVGANHELRCAARIPCGSAVAHHSSHDKKSVDASRLLAMPSTSAVSPVTPGGACVPPQTSRLPAAWGPPRLVENDLGKGRCRRSKIEAAGGESRLQSTAAQHQGKMHKAWLAPPHSDCRWFTGSRAVCGQHHPCCLTRQRTVWPAGSLLPVHVVLDWVHMSQDW
ncbi:hypothetical protein FH972_021671 [Carpinus fangiana]|uniref:Uncharacterized protein n=1 Tax=Carpinus fangiana TaxID=176857 RepID=A0A5N6KPZ2_9ROSI|nr:hypothetical protein FH972_021671 [Carpinus fangiana]